MPWKKAVMKAAVKAVIASCAVVAVACEGGMQAPMSPSAVPGVAAALNADGSNLKATQPINLVPLHEVTNVSLTPTFASIGSQSVNVLGATFAYRFQVSESESFDNLAVNAMGSVDVANVVRYTVETALQNNQRYVWRVRAELEDAVGPWSDLGAFTTVTASGTVVTNPGPSGPAGPRAPDPPPGQILPLPDLFHVVLQFSDTSNSCPRGIQYVNNPWQDRVIDAFRQLDSRWGYNGKPTRTADQNGGFPVVAAGDEAAYHYSAGPSQGSPDVHLVDMLISHCGGNPTVGWRVFTGEEPGFWTGAGRF
jgi:hypothetical protein